jgi:hypothetical protein
MDREGDKYDLLSELQAAQTRYIIRLSHNRRLVGERDKLREVMARAPSLLRRAVHVGRRAVGHPRDHHAPREDRDATLEVSATTVGRAYDKLLVLEQGWAASQAARDPIDD